MTTLLLSCRQAILDWDGRSAAGLDRIAEAMRAVPEGGAALPALIATLIDLMAEPACEQAAARLIKRLLETDMPFDDSLQSLADRIYVAVAGLHSWQAHLPILQCVACLPISANAAPAVEAWLRQCLVAPNVFVRAWAYNGFYLLGRAHHRFSDEADALLEMGLRDEPPSVRARIRRCQAESGNSGKTRRQALTA